MRFSTSSPPCATQPRWHGDPVIRSQARAAGLCASQQPGREPLLLEQGSDPVQHDLKPGVELVAVVVVVTGLQDMLNRQLEQVRNSEVGNDWPALCHGSRAGLSAPVPATYLASSNRCLSARE
jgi:hypothetical protein